MVDREELHRLKTDFPQGARVQLIQMVNESIAEGEKGTVRCIDDIGTIHVNWDNGSTLGVVYKVDKIKRIHN